jgi:large subunit ribosomal protein L25
MAQRVTITAQPRTVLGKKVKRLRAQGLLPANVYGAGIDSQAIQLDTLEFLRILRHEGVRSMFELQIEGETNPRHVLIRGLMRYGGTGDPLHADFYQVRLDQEVTTRVAIVLTGESPAVTDLQGTLVQNLDTLQVRCLPLDIPESFEIDISALATFEDTIHVGDVPAPKGVTIEEDPETPIASVMAPRLMTEDEEEAEAAAEAAVAEEGEAAATEAEGEEATEPESAEE